VFGPWVEFGQGGNGILLEARDLDAPASRLGMSRRTLHRQLARDGESFSSILQCSAERPGAALC
jgi:hypothetical protein